MSGNKREWQSWYDMKRRCTDVRRREYQYYGARGITYCNEWESFATFLKDMGPCPKGFTLDRVKNHLGYSKENCRWADRSTQNLNKRPYSNSTSGVKGVSMNRTNGYEYWTAFGCIGRKTIRLYHGKDFEEAVRIRKEWEALLIKSGDE